ncbi:MAG: M28 family peptidase [Lentisphaerae bacterium]|nr:M28 family peptidase [Lentisphaerota bacterium]
MKGRVLTLTAWWLAVAALAPAAMPAPVTSPEFAADCQALTRAPHRLCGTPAGEAAADYLAQRLRDVGVKTVMVQPFPSVQTSVRRCEMTVEGRGDPLPLLPMRPNGILPPTTPPEGLAGRLVRLDVGAIGELAAADVRDAVAVMDYNAGDGWLRALRFGARAVVFVRGGACDAGSPHAVAANVNLPRFYYEGDPSALPTGREAVIHSEVVWDAVTGRNVIGFIPGLAPTFAQGKEEVVILSAPFDSFGDVPERSPGARGAANCAALLELAGQLVRSPARRHVLVVFYDNQARLHAGASHFYRALENNNAAVTTDGRRTALEAERQFLQDQAARWTDADPLRARTPSRRPLLDRCVDKVAQRAFTLDERLYARRGEVAALQRAGTGDPATSARLEAIDREIARDLTPRKDAINRLRRALGRDRTDGLDPEAAAALRDVLTDVARDLAARTDELTAAQAALDADSALKALIGDKWIALHVALALGDATPRWGVLIGGDSPLHSPNDNAGLYGKVQGVFLRAFRNAAGAQPEAFHFAEESVNQSLPTSRVLWAAPTLLHSGEVAGLYGIYNVVLGTTQDRLAREGTPDDRLAALDLEHLEQQAREIGAIISTVATLDETSDLRDESRVTDAVADQRALSLRRGIVASKEYAVPTFASGRSSGPSVMGIQQGSSVPDTPVAGAVIQLRPRSDSSPLSYDVNKPPAFDPFQVLRTDQNGQYALGPLPGWFFQGVAATFDEDGNVREISNTAVASEVRYRLNLFRCRAGWQALPPQQSPRLAAGDTLRILSARSDALLDPRKSYRELADGVVAWFVDRRETRVKLFGLPIHAALNNGPEAGGSETAGRAGAGQGVPADGNASHGLAAEGAARDLWRLNEARIDLLRRKGILDSSLAELHGRAEDLLIETEREPTPRRRQALFSCAFWASHRVYSQTLALLNDVVFAVLILLGLSIPFAFALERVLIGATTIHRQLAWFAAFFALTFLTLYLSHPAFAIANTPVIIFLGFAIGVMSAVMIAVVMRKFEVELKALQGLTGTVHAADVSRVSTFIAAMQMGISTMRRRPLRTALTAVTIILLTFTILCFASFTTHSGIVSLFLGPRPAYAGVWLHNVNWQPLSEDMTEVLAGRWGTQATLCRRLWLTRLSVDDAGVAVSSRDGLGQVLVSGVLGLDAAEAAARPDLAAALGSDWQGRILMTAALAHALGVEPGDPVRIKGMSLTVGPLLDAVSLSDLKDMDGAGVLPVDFAEQASVQQSTPADDDPLQQRRSWRSLDADAVVVVAAETARVMGAALYGLALYTADDAAAQGIAEDIARMLPLPVATTRPSGAFRLLLGTVLAASGVRSLFFPVLLGGLVIFGTMLGSVSDREREIYTFSALGLAPRHVATLFLAEAIVYSLIGGMGGYLLAQGTLKGLTALAAYGWVRVPQMNMTSTNTVGTILIVMGTVLVSSLYPAVKASRSANPGLMRVWKPPLPQGDVMAMVFPFTVSTYDITGVVSFLKEHFDNYSETGLGRFMAQEARLVQSPGGMLGLDARLALAPFDLGVSQTFALRSVASEIQGIDEVAIRLERASGQPTDWQRLNKVFLDDLRRQFLLWRSLAPATMELYRSRTLVALGTEAEPELKNQGSDLGGQGSGGRVQGGFTPRPEPGTLPPPPTPNNP